MIFSSISFSVFSDFSSSVESNKTIVSVSEHKLNTVGARIEKIKTDANIIWIKDFITAAKIVFNAYKFQTFLL